MGPALATVLAGELRERALRDLVAALLLRSLVRGARCHSADWFRQNHRLCIPGAQRIFDSRRSPCALDHHIHTAGAFAIPFVRWLAVQKKEKKPKIQREREIDLGALFGVHASLAWGGVPRFDGVHQPVGAATLVRGSHRELSTIATPPTRFSPGTTRQVKTPG